MTKCCNITSEDLDNIIQDLYLEFTNRNLCRPKSMLNCACKKCYYAYVANKFISDAYAQIDLYVDNKYNVTKSICSAVENILSTYGYGYVVIVTDGGKWISYQIFERDY